MSIASALFGPTTPVVRTRGRGRPPVANDPAQRKVHETCATARLLYGRSVADCKWAFGVSGGTVTGWTGLALTYSGPIGDALRRANASPSRFANGSAPLPLALESLSLGLFSLREYSRWLRGQIESVDARIAALEREQQSPAA